MPAISKQKVACLNPNSGGTIQLDKATYDLFSKAIQHVLMGQVLTFTQMTSAIKKYFIEHQITFDGSVGWYAVTIKNDMHARGIIDVFTGKGKKLHQLSK